MRSSADCKTGLLTSSWEGADGALRYIVEAFGNRGNQSHYMCSSLTQSCTISDINCGESLTMIITAADNECSSVLSLGEIGQTGEWQSPLVDKQWECTHNCIWAKWGGMLDHQVAWFLSEYHFHLKPRQFQVQVLPELGGLSVVVCMISLRCSSLPHRLLETLMLGTYYMILAPFSIAVSFVMICPKCKANRLSLTWVTVA